MRPFEIAILIANVPTLGWCVATRRPPVWARTVAMVALVVTAMQIMIEGHRWQMYPGYLVIAGLPLAITWPRMAGLGIWLSLAGLSCLAVSAIICILMPVFKLPNPTGPFPIGSITRHLVDSNRKEIQGSDPGAQRELMIQMWYPAAMAGPARTYCSRAEMPLKKKHLSLVKTHAATGVPLAGSAARYPVLIFCPAWTGGRIQNTFQAEELASHGFVVVGIDHPYSAQRTVFPDGRVITSALGAWLDFSSDSRFEASLGFVNAQLRVRTADARFVLDSLERWDRSDPDGLLTDRLDIARVGIWGHSFGGAVAAEACRLDTRFRAAIDLDGCIFGESAKAGIEQPFLVMSSDDPAPSASEIARSRGARHRNLSFLHQDEQNIRNSLIKHGGYFLHITGASHMNYCDGPLFSPIKRFTGAGPIDDRRSMRIINDYTLAFFNQYLNGRPNDLLAVSSIKYPEVRFEAWQRARSDVVPAPEIPAHETHAGQDHATLTDD